MFDLSLGEELSLLQGTARSFAEERLWPALRAHERAGGVAGDVRDHYDATGLAALELPEALGGAGLGAVARVLVNEELGACDAGAALALDALGPTASVLRVLGGDEAVRTHLSPLLETPGARALLVWAPDTTLVREDTRVTGSVPWVPASQVALLVVLDASGAYLVREGIEAVPVHGAGLRAAGAAELCLSAAPVAASFGDAEGAALALAHARLYLASLLLGVLRRSADYARGYALEREAFGKPIAHHQALAFLLVELSMAVQGARLLLHDAAWRLDAGHDAAVASALAFAEVVEASRLVGPAGVQVLGGHGFMQDHPVEKHMREARALGLMLGGIDAAREAAGAALCALEPPLELSVVDAGR